MLLEENLTQEELICIYFKQGYRNNGPHTRFAGQWPAGFSKRVASGTQGKASRNSFEFINTKRLTQSAEIGKKREICGARCV